MQACARAVCMGSLALALCACARSVAPASHQSPSPSASPVSSTPAVEEFPPLRSVSCLASDADLSHPKPVSADSKSVKRYLDSYDLAAVRELRAAFDAYASGRADLDTHKNLAPYGALADDGFCVIDLQRSMGGGYLISIQFHHHPQAQYDLWLYILAGARPSVRAFQQVRCTPAEQKWIATTLGPLMALGDDKSLARRRSQR